MLLSTILVFVSSILPFAAGGTHGSSHRSRHQDVAHRARGDVGYVKRGGVDNARFTFYDVGLGACGKISFPADFIVALSTVNFGEGFPGPHCFEEITITYNGKTAQATIMDECMGCPDGGLDFSIGLFTFFAPTSNGVLYGTWSSGGGSSEPSTTTSSSISTPTPTPTPTPSPTSTRTTTSSSTTSDTPTTSSTSTTSIYTTSSSSITSSTTSTTSASNTSTSTTSTSTAVPTGNVTSDGQGQTLASLNDAITGLASLLSSECGV